MPTICRHSVALACLWSILCSNLLSTVAVTDRAPNVVFLFAEDMGYGDLACYGHPYARTPNLDKLAEEGTKFMNYHVTGTTCSPSRMGIMTGRHPASLPNYMADWGYQGLITVTQLLKDANFTTGHYGKWHMGPDESDGTYGIDDARKVGPTMRNVEGKDFAVYEAAMAFIEDNKDQPFYVNVWGHISHTPVKPHESLVSLFRNVTVDRDDFGKHMHDKIDLSERIGGDVDNSMQNYLADVYAMDYQVGKLLKKIDDLGLRENTIVVFSTDGGPAPVKPDGGQSIPENMMGYSGGFRGYKHDFFEGGLRVPFIVRWPGHVPAGKENGESVLSGLDWLPTIASAANVPYDSTMFEGENMLDVWFGSRRQRINPLYWKTTKPKSESAMMYKNYKLFLTEDKEWRLYDLRENYEEDVDVFETLQYQDVAQAMKAQLLLWDSTLPEEYCKNECDEPFPFDPTEPPATPSFDTSFDPTAQTEKPTDEVQTTASPTTRSTTAPVAPTPAPPPPPTMVGPNLSPTAGTVDPGTRSKETSGGTRRSPRASCLVAGTIITLPFLL